MQTRTESIKETIVDVVTGYVISIIITFFINYIHDIEIALWKNFSMTACYTVVSMIRKYIIRRYFNGKEKTKPFPNYKSLYKSTDSLIPIHNNQYNDHMK